MALHSPGPWVIAHENAGGGYSIRDARGRNIGHSAAARSQDGKQLAESDRVEEPEAQANGRVMVAGPEMLTLLDDVQQRWGQQLQYQDRELANRILAVVKKIRK